MQMYEETAKLLKIYQTGFTVCLVLAIAFLLIAILLFFVFNIKQIFLIRTGKAAKRDIKKLEEQNFNTGRLSKRNNHTYYEHTDSLELSQEFGKTEQMVTEHTSPPLQYQQETDNSTTVLGQNETSVLSGNETTVLNAGETTVLGNQNVVPQITRKFVIIKNEMLIHTEELI